MRASGAETRVVVLGAGMAGLAAARVIAEAGREVLVLEAGSRVGGRIHTVRTGTDEPMELGAEFVHGRPRELWELIAEAGLETYERVGSFLVSEGGVLGEQAWGGGERDGDDTLERLKTYAGPDMSFAAYIDSLGLENGEREQAVGYVEGFNAADAREASVLALGRQQAAEDAIDGERLWKIRGGYDQLPKFLAAKVRAAGGRIEFGACVTAVKAGGESGLTVLCADGRRFAAAHVVVALPLGVLGDVELPVEAAALLRAAGAMRMGAVCRVTFRMRQRLWPETMSFLLAQGGEPAVWWTDRPESELTITGWTGGPRAMQLLALPAGELRRRAEAGLAAALGITVELVRQAVEGFHFFDWKADPQSKGAYSWVPVGGLESSAAMSEPIRFAGGGSLQLAGEHTDTTGLWGTVHAAYGSGLRAGRAVVGR